MGRGKISPDVTALDSLWIGFLPVDWYWYLPLIFVTGWILGYVHFRDTLHRKHPDLHAQWLERKEKRQQKQQEERLERQRKRDAS